MAKKKLPSALERQLAQAVPTTPDATPKPAGKASKGKDEDVSVHIKLPRSVIKQIKRKALDEDSTIRSILLEGLQSIGIKGGETGDRRKK